MKKCLLIVVRISVLCLVLASAPAPAHAGLADGLVGYWTMDGKDVNWSTGTVTDISGQGNSGKVVSMSTTTASVAGKTGQGLYFNGSTNYITVPDNDIFTITGARTFSLWMKTASTTGFRAINKSTGPILNTSEWALGTSGGGLYYVIFYDSGATANNCSVGSTVSASTDVNTWTHLIVTYSGSGGCSGIKLYRNAVDVTGSVVNAGTGFSSFSNTSAPVTFGVVHKGDPVYEAWAKGTMDDIRVYNRALSAQEIRQLYSLGAARVSASPTTPLNNGLVGYWTMDGKDVNWATGSVSDLSGQGNTGKVVSMSTTTSPVPGKVGQGLKFDGVNDYVNHGDVLDMGANSLSACGWFKADNPAISNGGIIGKTVAASGMGRWAVYFEGGKINALLARGTLSADNAIASTTIANLTLPHHFCAAYDRSNLLTLYVDAVSVSTISIASTTPTNYNTTYPLWIGAYQDATATGIYPGYAFDGLIDEVRIYNRALSAQEVRQLYALGQAKFATSPVNALKSGLVGYWTMDGKNIDWSTNTITDASGNGNTGTTTNTFSTTTSPVSGKIGQALDFRSTSIIGIPNSSSLQVGNVFTFSAWVKMDSLTARQSIFSTRSNADAGGWNIEVGPAGIDGVGDKRVPNSVAVATPGLFNAVSDNVLATSTWAHITYVRNGDSVGTQKIYVNGILRTLSTDNPQAIVNNTAIKLIGATTYPGNFDGTIDDVRLYNRALSAQEILQLYKLGSSVKR